ncbi:MAG: hypothetical protein IJC48_03520 [Clostridia bacterium]|nr:hypothetical protein [Clostridia bacterium]
MINEITRQQAEAYEKLSRLKLGALYCDDRKTAVDTILLLIHNRFARLKIDGVVWLCERKRIWKIEERLQNSKQEISENVRVFGMESLSHSLSLFLDILGLAECSRQMIVIDNGLLVKNIGAVRTRRVIGISKKCIYRLLVNAVPFTNKPGDMFSQWLALDWRILGYKTQWGFNINHPVQNGIISNSDYLTRAIEPYCASIRVKNSEKSNGRHEYVYRFELPSVSKTEYKRVSERFLMCAINSSTGVYRLLQACQQAACGRRIINDYPLATEPIYDDPNKNMRLQSLIDVVKKYPGKRIFIMCRYLYEVYEVKEGLESAFSEKADIYPEIRNGSRFTVMNVFSDERAKDIIEADVIVYYSSHWDWRKRMEKENSCLQKNTDNWLTVVSLIAIDTIDQYILKSVWRKENLVMQLKREIAARM